MFTTVFAQELGNLEFGPFLLFGLIECRIQWCVSIVIRCDYISSGIYKKLGGLFGARCRGVPPEPGMPGATNAAFMFAPESRCC
jgi:hypothetical protein